MKRGKQFEVAVHKFVQALAPDATVLFDHKVPDRTLRGRLRQVDCWVETAVLGLYPVSIAISCKDHSRPLTIGAIETFRSEIESVGATFGVLYSASGFTEDAPEKATAWNICCCRLYQNEPAEVPERIWLWGYCSHSACSLTLADVKPGLAVLTWADVLESRLGAGDERVIDRLVEEYQKQERSAIDQAARNRGIPDGWSADYEFHDGTTHVPFFRIIVRAWWRVFRGRMEAHLLNGSYCFANKSFVGQLSTPPIDTWSSHPGEWWEEVQWSDVPPTDRVLGIRFRSKNLAEQILESIGKQHPAVLKCPDTDAPECAS